MVDNIQDNTILQNIAGCASCIEQDIYSNNYLQQKIRPLQEIEKEAIENAVRLCDGNIPKASVFLEVAPSTIYRKLKQWEKTLAKDISET